MCADGKSRAAPNGDKASQINEDENRDKYGENAQDGQMIGNESQKVAKLSKS